MILEKDAENKKLIISRSFDAPLDEVWDAWTKAELLDKWWAPKPYKAETKILDFRVGGMWLYCMAGPSGDRNWSRVDYLKIEPKTRIETADCFCDEEGNTSADFPEMKWYKQFSESDGKTTVSMEIVFQSEEDLNKILEMGFREGFAIGLENLDELLAA